MSRRSEPGTKLLGSYRAATNLSAEQRARALQKLQARMRIGAAPQHHVDLPVPELPRPESALHGGAWKRVARVGRVLIGLGLISWLGMDAETASPTSDPEHRSPAAQSGELASDAASGARSRMPRAAAESGVTWRPGDAGPGSAAGSNETGKLSPTAPSAAASSSETSRRRENIQSGDAARAADGRSARGLAGGRSATNVMAATSGTTDHLPPGAASAALPARGRPTSQAAAQGIDHTARQDAAAAEPSRAPQPLRAASHAQNASTASEPLRATARAEVAEEREQPLPAAARAELASRAAEPRGEPLRAASRAELASRAPEQGAQQLRAAGLEQETALMEQAQAALRRGDAQRALALLAEHTWLFPKGHLSEARDVARIDALCKAGHVEHARARAQQFLATRAHSPFAARVRASCLDASANRTAP